MDLKALLPLLVALFLVVDTIGAPIQFPEETSIGDSQSYNGEARFHHHKKKKRKKKKLGCLLHHHRYRSSDTPEGRTFLFGLNYYDTDINIFNQGHKPNRPEHGDNCGGIHEVIGGLGSLLPSGGSLIPSTGSTGSSGSSSSSSSSSSSGSSGDDNDDYDYSDGAPSTGSTNTGSSNSPTNSFGQGVSNLSSFVSSAPGVASSFVTTFGNGIRPIFERPERYFDYYVVRPINKSLRNLVNWF